MLKSTDDDEINRAVFEWFVSARAKGVPVSGTLIQSSCLSVLVQKACLYQEH